MTTVIFGKMILNGDILKCGSCGHARKFRGLDVDQNCMTCGKYLIRIRAGEEQAEEKQKAPNKGLKFN